jgi:tetratricopeptide (TPR) repeat protein
MFKRRILFILIFTLLYQSPLLSKSTSFSEFSSRNLSKYFSGIVALENQKNSDALEFFNTSKILINRHDPYLEKLVTTLVLEDKVAQAINLIRINDEKNNSQFFEAYVLLALDHLKKNNINKALEVLSEVPEEFKRDRFNFIIVNSLIQYANVFKYKKVSKEKLNFGNLSLISETFQRCYLDDESTDTFFSTLINNSQADYSRYIYFYLTYLIEKNRIEDAKAITEELEYVNTTLPTIPR